LERFILRNNIARFEERLAHVTDARELSFLRERLAEWRRQLSLLEADRKGAYFLSLPSIHAFSSARQATEIRDIFESQSMPSLLLHPGSGLRIVDMNEAYAGATMTGATKVGGEKLFDVFPDNPDDPAADGVANLFASLQTAATTGKPHAMAVQRYDISDGQGGFLERYWQPCNTPILNEQGQLMYLLHQVEDVTGLVTYRRARGRGDRGDVS
jgi:hypothetical protein